jgi:hypothetical protein
LDHSQAKLEAKKVFEKTPSCHARSLGKGHNLNGAIDVKPETWTAVRPTSVHLLPRIKPETRPLLASGGKMSPEPVMYFGRWPIFETTIHKSGLSSNDPTIPNPAKDYLLSVHMTGGSHIALRFLDGKVGELDLADLGLDTSKLRIGTIKASSWGGAAEVEDRNWHTIHIDSSVLRAHIDPQYAALLKEAIADLQ